MELKAYSDETIRLKHLLQQALRFTQKDLENEPQVPLEERYITLVNELKKEKQLNDEQRETIATQQGQIKDHEKKISELERNIQRLTKEKTLIKQQLTSREKDLEMYRGKDE